MMMFSKGGLCRSFCLQMGGLQPPAFVKALHAPIQACWKLQIILFEIGRGLRPPPSPPRLCLMPSMLHFLIMFFLSLWFSCLFMNFSISFHNVYCCSSFLSFSSFSSCPSFSSFSCFFFFFFFFYNSSPFFIIFSIFTFFGSYSKDSA